jgi:hypothetical protein
MTPMVKSLVSRDRTVRQAARLVVPINLAHRALGAGQTGRANGGYRFPLWVVGRSKFGSRSHQRPACPSAEIAILTQASYASVNLAYPALKLTFLVVNLLKNCSVFAVLVRKPAGQCTDVQLSALGQP